MKCKLLPFLCLICMSCLRTSMTCGTGHANYADTIDISFSKDISIVINNSNESYYHSTSLYRDSLLYCMNLDYPNIIDIIDITLKNKETLNISDTTMFKNGLFNFNVISQDSILFYLCNPPKFILIDSTGSIKRQMQGENTRINYYKGHKYHQDDFLLYSFLSAFKPVYSDNLLYIGVDPFGLYSKNRNLKRIGVFDISENKWSSFFSNSIENGVKRKGYGFPYDIDHPYICISEQGIVVSYPMMHSVCVYDKQSLRLIKKSDIQSSENIVFPDPKKLNFWDSCQKTWDFRRTTPFYGPIFYHDKIGLYSRVVYHEMELFDDYGIANTDKNRRVSIVFFDKCFKVIKEVFLPEGSICFNGCWGIKDGLLLTNNLSVKDSIILKKLLIKSNRQS